MVTSVCKETQKKAFGGKIIPYPVQQILVVDKNTFCITCRDINAANSFQTANKAYQQALITESETRDYELIKKTNTELVLRGKDAKKVLDDYANTGLLSDKLLGEVTNLIVNNSKNDCVIL